MSQASHVMQSSRAESGEPGALYVVATPIGNLDDMSTRALDILRSVDVIAAEDTRHSARLMAHFDIRTPMLALHDHNERTRAEQLVARIEQGERIALISDAGTPLISDPGYRLVAQLRSADLRVVPVPGPCALVAALSGAGVATDRFRFEGFLPARSSARKNALEALVRESATLVFYESPHRITDSLTDIAAVFGERRLVLARELTKRFETFLEGSAEALLAIMADDPDQARGEFVVIVEGAPEQSEEEGSVDAEQLLMAMFEAGVGTKQIATVATRLLGGRKQQWYERAQQLKDAQG
ncbi:16S rRNA (cytidine(1402)-2'-O)-methyltransferase [Carnimonas nigrificans]|uniref:16S rRNA (cytidine(1402)-2'-O)-methyltransferase n=1 Tax=Carnimonas nigrificans TaxID=64323 RepID=UPI00046F7094|nr:16S rRNA (cytidine(1402)-2'-O)-methyltransferase [Carnimonas nigrificans]